MYTGQIVFAQLTERESLCDIESFLQAMKPRLYHMGIRDNISRSTLAYAFDSTTIYLCMELFPTLPAASAAHFVLRSPDRKISCVPDQQLYPAGSYRHLSIQGPMGLWRYSSSGSSSTCASRLSSVLQRIP